MLTRTRSPKVIREATRLRAIRGAPFIEAGGKQYAELGEVMTPDEGGDADALLRVPTYAEADGQRIETGARFKVLQELPPGRYDQLRADRHTPSAPLRPADALRGLNLLALRPGLIAAQPGATPAPGVKLGGAASHPVDLQPGVATSSIESRLPASPSRSTTAGCSHRLLVGDCGATWPTSSRSPSD